MTAFSVEGEGGEEGCARLVVQRRDQTLMLWDPEPGRLVMSAGNGATLPVCRLSTLCLWGMGIVALFAVTVLRPWVDKDT
jgi:hypothetical protein